VRVVLLKPGLLIEFLLFIAINKHTVTPESRQGVKPEKAGTPEQFPNVGHHSYKGAKPKRAS
tara:strand:+ start:480 stop:665 length:186 start_codon:yes stop_codon:yes gene_type:complete